MRRSTYALSKPLEFAKAAAKQFRHIVEHKRLLQAARSQCPVSTPVYFFPEKPHPYSVCYKVFHRLGILPRKGLPAPRDPAIVFCWKDDTYVDVPQLRARPDLKNVVNGNCLDISKQRVEEVHAKIFGYSLAVDPLTYRGRMAVKSNINGAHDGREVMGPVDRIDPQSVYQRIVDNTASPDAGPQAGNMVCDIRIPVIGHTTHFAYLKYRPKDNRFSNVNAWVRIVDTSSALSPEEIERFNAFCQAFGLDYGEVDVVRDAADGRIYVLDVNKTPHGPPNGLSSNDQAKALELYKAAFVPWLKQLEPEYKMSQSIS